MSEIFNQDLRTGIVIGLMLGICITALLMVLADKVMGGVKK